MFSFLLGKTIRIMLIINNKKLKKQTHGPLVVFMIASILSGIYAAILLLNHFLNTPMAVREYALNDEVNFRLVCSGPLDGIFGQLKFWYSAALIFGGVAVCYLTKDFVALFNESKHIAFAIQAIFFLSIVVLPTSSMLLKLFTLIITSHFFMR